ncbi:MAG: VOC family protein [Pseudomonadota bacterium]
MTKKRKIIVTVVGLILALAIAAAWLGYTVIKSATPRDVEPDAIIQGVNFVGIYVDDVDAAEAYYASSVGTEAVDAPELDPSGLLATFGANGVSTENDVSTEDVAQDDEGDTARPSSRLIRSSNAQLWLMSSANRSESGAKASAVPVNGTGIAHVCFQVARETDAYAKMVDAGASTIGSPELVHLNPGNPVYYGYLADRYGIITEVEEVDVAALDLPQPPTNKYRIRHVSLATPDIDAMIDFYSAFLGGQEPRHAGWLSPFSGETVDQVSGLVGSELEMAWFQIRNLELEIFQYHSHLPERLSEPRPLDAPGYNMIVLDVSDLDAARKRFIDAGGELVAGPESFAGGLAIYGRDPDGNLLVLHKVAGSSPFSAKNFADNGAN